ncbi:MAG: FtsH protease activity modulator HflK [Deltaproteobacteria bacterium]|nr:FtsH protease activity modulator HflK [Deltaproteobacteria bacterium]
MSQKTGRSFEQVMEEFNRMMGKGNGHTSGRDGPEGRKTLNRGWLQWLLIAAFVVLYGLISSFYKIDTSEKGVITRFGAFHGIAEEGPHFRLPFGIDQVYKVEVTRIHEEAFGFRRDGAIHHSDSRKESMMLTGDLKVAMVEWIVQYRVNDPKKYLFSAFKVRQHIRDVSISVMRRVVGDKLVTDVLTKDRLYIEQQAKLYTQETLDRFDMGVMITNLHLQNVTPPEEVRAAFNEVNIAKQEKDQMVNQAKGIYNRVIPEAEGKAAKVLAEAEGYAIRVVNSAEGDAEKFRTVLEEYRKAPELTRKRLYLDTMERILSQSDRLTIVDPQAKGLIPVYGQTLPAFPAGQSASASHPSSDS